MNTLSLAIEPVQGKDNHLSLILKIDGIEFISLLNKEFNAVVFERLAASATNSGKFLIFTCSCGVAECGGWEKVAVTHRSNSIAWTFTYNFKLYRFEFDKDLYKQEIERLKIDLLRYNGYVIEPERIVEPSEFGDAPRAYRKFYLTEPISV